MINNNSKNLNFGSTLRAYKSKQIESYFGNYTWPFRHDLNWLELAFYIHENFQGKDKVNLVQFASSDGSEAYTVLISLLESSNELYIKKYLPLKAFDIDSHIIQIANSGLINLTTTEANDLKKEISFDKYFSLSPKKLIIEDELESMASNTYKVNEFLTKNVKFQVGDMFKKIEEIEDNSNTILLCRNCLSYFTQEKVEEFINKVSNKLKKNSLFVIGGLENFKYIEKKGFTRIMPGVFQKMI